MKGEDRVRIHKRILLVDYDVLHHIEIMSTKRDPKSIAVASYEVTATMENDV